MFLTILSILVATLDKNLNGPRTGMDPSSSFLRGPPHIFVSDLFTSQTSTIILHHHSRWLEAPASNTNSHVSFFPPITYCGDGVDGSKDGCVVGGHSPDSAVQILLDGSERQLFVLKPLQHASAQSGTFISPHG